MGEVCLDRHPSVGTAKRVFDLIVRHEGEARLAFRMAQRIREWPERNSRLQVEKFAFRVQREFAFTSLNSNTKSAPPQPRYGIKSIEFAVFAPNGNFLG
jgi:hypothetical protein